MGGAAGGVPPSPSSSGTSGGVVVEVDVVESGVEVDVVESGVVVVDEVEGSGVVEVDEVVGSVGSDVDEVVGSVGSDVDEVVGSVGSEVVVGSAWRRTAGAAWTAPVGANVVTTATARATAVNRPERLVTLRRTPVLNPTPPELSHQITVSKAVRAVSWEVLGNRRVRRHGLRHGEHRPGSPGWIAALMAGGEKMAQRARRRVAALP
jgi:hypothetical protein